MALRVRTEYITTHDHIYYIQQFRSIVPYLYLANNANIYNLILTDETKEDIKAIDDHLRTTKKNPEFQRNRLWICGSSEEQAQWASEYSFQYCPITDDILAKINAPDYQPKCVEAPAWKYANNCTVMPYYASKTLAILRMEGFEHNWDILPYISPSTFVFVQIPCMFTKWNYTYARDVLHSQNPALNPTNIIWECNDLDTILLASEYSFSYIFANNNCWLDYNAFTIIDSEKIYNMVMNSRPERNFKRPYLARAVPSLAYIKGYNFKKNDLYDNSELQTTFVNEQRIPKEQVMQIYNKSYCGGIFSAAEGACYSSSEYLLCGLPVVSTDGRGGRDTWFDAENSIIVEPDEFAVKKAVETWIERINAGTVNPVAVREKHILLQEQMRKNFNDKVQELFNMHTISINAHEYFSTKYKHYFKEYHTIDVLIKMLTQS